jgi:capsule polysaccharide modification protein KpsS
MDYTKGLEERFRAVERLFELRPEWIGRFTFVQIAAPTRNSIEQYHMYEERVRALVERINARFVNRRAPAIVLIVAHHDADEVYEYYRSGDLCVAFVAVKFEITGTFDGVGVVCIVGVAMVACGVASIVGACVVSATVTPTMRKNPMISAARISIGVVPSMSMFLPSS